MAGKVKPIPEGLSTVTPHLFVKDAAKAIDFYKKALAAEELARMPGPDGKTLLHGAIRIGNSTVFVADPFGPGAKASEASLMVFVEDVDKLFNRAVEAGCKVIMPLANQFWGDRYGIVADPFGQTWQMATHVEDVPPEEMAKRAAKPAGA